MKENRVVGNWEWTVPKVTYINFLLNNISIHTGHREKRENALIFYLILSTSFLRNIWRSVRIICMWILVLKGLSRHFFSGQAGNLALKKPEGLNWAELTFTNTSWIAEKTADISMATLPLVSPPNNVWETSAEIPYGWQDLGSDASSVSVPSFLRHHLAGKPVVTLPNVSCFLKLLAGLLLGTEKKIGQ